MKEIDQTMALPLGEGVNTNVLDFADFEHVPKNKLKELKMTQEDQEYFSGAKKNLFGKKAHKVCILFNLFPI